MDQHAAGGTPVAAVTGAGQGIGRAVSELLAESGYDLVLNDINPETLAAAVASVTALGRRAVAVPGDIRDAAVTGQIVAAAASLGRLDALVNNAGAWADPGLRRDHRGRLGPPLRAACARRGGAAARPRSARWPPAPARPWSTCPAWPRR